MSRHEVTFFEPYEFIIGEKITIAGGPRQGDWKVIEQSDRKVTLRCPVSGRELTWDRFCYMMVKKEDEEWPHSS